MTMIFRDGFFHGDPHPANILVLPPELIGLVDFGLGGKLTQATSRNPRGSSSTRERERRGAPKRLFDLGVRYPQTRGGVDLRDQRSTRAITAAAAEIDPQQVIREVFGLIYSMNIRLPTRFVLLDKAVATLGSVGSSCIPTSTSSRSPVRAERLMGRFTPRRVLAGQP